MVGAAVSYWPPFTPGEPVVVVRPAMTADRYGNQTPDWTNTAEYELTGCAVAPGSMDEHLDGRESGVEVDHTLYVTADVGTGIYGWSVYGESLEAIWPTDRLRFRGEEHEVVGRVAIWEDPNTGYRPGCVVRTKRMEG